ncbi:protein SEY1 homolog isoform X2 [Hylaeus volcanicus]|uniref:protein SEY1 homolog isoform X2 n=1 Tax=Hylaeus volcanicus TaxID=313075 RepID=UPI0023B7CEDA|nr:protein SEY1 homolog isoform X2 [Hylaeus volcanicus]
MNEFVEIIDYNGNFTGSPSHWLKKADLTTRGFDYSVITVLGCQSSGKSTMLNTLFGTTFPVMDASLGRSQTTKGLWLAKDLNSPTIVVDVEGTDSKERGEDRLTFEHRTALFSLALADCVLVNMWYHDLGRYTASNYGLLKTVLGVNLELFQTEETSSKTTMVFVIRDYNRKLTPLKTLEAMIHDDLKRLWKDTPKPTMYAESSADDFFNFEIVGLPSFIERPEEFISACAAFRQRWLASLRPKQYSRGVPADGFPFYVEKETVLQSAQLDIPSQKTMLAIYRCDELKSEAFTCVMFELQDFLKDVQVSGSSVNVRAWSFKIINLALDMFDPPASRYDSIVYKKKRIQLIQNLQREIQKVGDVILSKRRQEIFDDFSRKTNLFLEKLNTQQQVFDACLYFRKTIDEAKKEALKELLSEFETINLDVTDEDIKEHFQIDTAQHEQALSASMESAVLLFYEHLLQKVSTEISQKAFESLGDVDRFLNFPDLSVSSFWSAIDAQIHNTLAILQEELENVLIGLESVMTEKQINPKEYFLKIIYQQIESKLKVILDWRAHYIMNRFQQFFNQDSQQVPRHWQNYTSDHIKDIYLEAREKSLVILSIFSDMESVEIFSDNDTLKNNFLKWIQSMNLKEDEILAKVQIQMQKAYQEAHLLQTTRGNRSRIPWWIWILLLALGYNELAMILASPFILLAVLFLCLVASITLYTNNFGLLQYLVACISSYVTSMISFGLSAFDATRPQAATYLYNDKSALARNKHQCVDEKK